MNDADAALRCSVVIPVHNRPALLRRVLDALGRQSVSPEAFEVIVCDDGSDDNMTHVTRDCAASLPRLRLLRQEHKGPAAARNLGIREASAPLVVFLDSDVIPGPTVVEALAHALETHPDWQGAEARLEPLGGRDTVCWDGPHSETGGQYHTAAIAYRAAVLVQVGGMDESFTGAACEDVDLAVRVMEHGPIGFVSSAVVRHPRRRRTVRSCWQARKHWRFVQILACRHRFLTWPEHKTSCPRLRTALAAVGTLPLGRLRRALSALSVAPLDGLRGVGLTAVDWLGGLAMLPSILFGVTPPRQSSLDLGRHQ